MEGAMDFNTPSMLTPEHIDKISTSIKNTVFPMHEFSDENEREIFALEEHSSWGETSFNELIVCLTNSLLVPSLTCFKNGLNLFAKAIFSVSFFHEVFFSSEGSNELSILSFPFFVFAKALSKI